MEISVDDVVLPGDKISKDCIENIDKKLKIIIGPGLRRTKNNEIIVTKPGVFRKKEPNTIYVDSYQKRYIPQKGEFVIGLVTNKGSDSLKVDIGSSENAQLSMLAFESATKKNKPIVDINDIVFAKLTAGGIDIEPELVCVDSSLKKDRYGVLNDGFMFSCSLNLIYKLLNPKFPLIKKLGEKIKFEIAVGLNGRVWVKADNVYDTICLVNAFLKAEFINLNDLNEYCKSIFKMKQ